MAVTDSFDISLNWTKTGGVHYLMLFSHSCCFFVLLNGSVSVFLHGRLKERHPLFMSVLITVIVFVVSLYTVYVLMCIAYLDNSRWYLNLRALFCDCIFMWVLFVPPANKQVKMTQLTNSHSVQFLVVWFGRWQLLCISSAALFVTALSTVCLQRVFAFLKSRLSFLSTDTFH